MRLLTDIELDLVAGGTDSTIVVHGWPTWEQFSDFFYLWEAGPGGNGGSGDPSAEENPFDDPDCDKANAIRFLDPPDNAKYYVPENVDKDFLLGVLNHLTDYAASHTAFALLREFESMFTDPTNPWFIDFKDWGTARGPTGSVSGGTTTYYSPAAGHDVTASVFEPFGNWFYGFAGTWAGISSDALYAAAALLQEGDNGFQDAPEDQPHVTAGILAAQGYATQPGTVFGVEKGSCPAGFTTEDVGATGLQSPTIYVSNTGNPNHAAYWSYLETEYTTSHV